MLNKQCTNGYISKHKCPQGSVFNPEISDCDWPANVIGCDVPVPEECAIFSRQVNC